MCNFFIQSFTDPSIFWGMLESLATTFALIFIFIELRRLKRESTEKKIEGLKFAAEHLEAPDFKSSYEKIENVVKVNRYNEVFPQEILEDLVVIFARLDFIAKLIKLDYLDQDVLLSFKGNDLLFLERFITNLENKKDSAIPSLKYSYPDGYKLLREVFKFKQLN